MDAGLLTMADLKRRGEDGQPLIDIADVADMNEILIVRAENRSRAEAAAKRKAEQDSRARGRVGRR